MAASAQRQSVEYALKVEIDDLKRALNDSLILLKANDAHVRGLADQLNVMAGAQNRVTSATRNQSAATRIAATQTRELDSAARSAAFNVKSLAFQLGALVGVFGVADVLRRTGIAIYDNARAYDTIRAKINLLTTDSREQADIMDYVRGTAARLGVEQRSLIDSYVRLRIASRGSVVEGKATQAVFEGLTTASAALRLSTDETRRAMKAFEQIISKGKLSAEEIRQQLGDVLPGALQLFQEASGKSAREFDKLLAQGKLFIDEGMFEKIADLLERDYGKGVNLNTIAAQVALLKNAYDDLFQTINQGGGQELIAGFLQALTRHIKNATEFMDKARFSGVEFAHTLSVIGTAAGSLLAANLFVRLATGVSALTVSLSGLASLGLVARVIQLRTALTGLMALFGGPWGIAAAAAFTVFATWRSESQKTADKTLELENRTRDLIDVIDLLSARQAQVKLDAVRDEIKKAKEEIDELVAAKDAVAKAKARPFGAFAFGGADATGDIERQLEQARVQFGLLSGEAIRLEGRLAAVNQETVRTGNAQTGLAEETDKATKSFLEEIDLMRLKLDLMTEGYELDQLDAAAKMVQAGLTRDQIGDYLQLTAALQGYTDAEKQAAKEAAELARESEKAHEAVERFLEKDSLKSIGSQMRDAFNDAGGALGDLIGRLEDVGNVQEKNADAIAANNKDMTISAEQRGKNELKIAAKTRQAYAGTYASMAGAAKGFFSANSRGYKALQAVEQGYRVAELALAVSNTLTKISLEEAFLGAKLSGDALSAESSVASASVQVAANTAVGASAATAGTANQALGDPYTAFARMAAMAGIMAALGYATGMFGGGGKSKNVAAARQAKQGTGTVFGDPKAKSESLSNALNALTDIQSDELDVSMDMLRSLRAIEADLTGVTRLVLRGTPNFGKGTVGYFYGAAIKEKARDTGLQFNPNQSVGDIMAGGLQAQFYADYKHAKDKYQAVNAELAGQFTTLITDISGSILQAVEDVGGDVAAAQAIIAGTALGIDLISLKGLSGEDAQKAIESVFSAFADSLAEEVMPAMAEFQAVGEGLFETLVRVGAETAATTVLLSDLGISLEALSFLERARIAENVIALSGGFDEFTSNITDFIESFYSADERLVMVGNRLSDTFSQLGLTLPMTRDGFRDLVEGIDVTTESGQMLFAALLSLSGQVDEYFTLQQEVTDSTEEMTDALSELLATIRRSIFELQGGDAALMEFNDALTALLSAADSAEQVEAGERLHDAIMERYEEQVEAIEEARDIEIKALEAQRQVAEDAVKTWEASAKIITGITDYLEELKRSPFAPGSPLERTQIALEQFRQQTSLALGGDLTAAGGLQKLAADVLSMARDTFASGGPFTDIYGEITGSLGMVAEALGIAPGADTAQATLDTIDQQIAEASGRADVLLDQLRQQTIAQLTALGDYLQYGNSRLDAMLLVMTGGQPVGGPVAPVTSTFETPASVATITTPNGAVTPVTGGVAPNTIDVQAIVDELRLLREEVQDWDQPINVTIQTGGVTQIVRMTLRQLREKSLRGETVIYAGGIAD